MAYGALPGNATTTADAIKAYVQAFLKSNFQTWIEFPPDLRRTWWRQKLARPVARLLRRYQFLKDPLLGRHYSRRPKRAASCALYVDADFAGEKARSTSRGPNSFFPLAWVCKRQTSVSQSTTIVSLAHSLYQEGLPALFLWSALLGQDDLETVIHEGLPFWL